MHADQPANPSPSAVPAAEVKTPWAALLIEDQEHIARQIGEYFQERVIAGRQLTITHIGRWEDAFGLIHQRKADLAILDIYRGEASKEGERIGEGVLDDFLGSGFIPVVIYTALPEGLESRVNEFVRLVPKTDGLPSLAAEIDSLFATHVPQMNRAILNHIDRALCDYMWGFVTKQWENLKEIADKPEFMRVLLQRLSFSLTRTGVEDALAEAFEGYDPKNSDPEKAHPAEFYIMPPLSQDPALGDVRIRKVGENTEHLVVLWPTCDMVSSEDRTPKTDIVLCARATLLSSFPEAQKYCEEQSKKKEEQSKKKLEALVRLMTNNRDGSHHFLPGFLSIPDLVVDFRSLEVLALDEVKKLPCPGVVASPYAEQMSFRFDSFRGRVGVRDVDLDVLLRDLGPVEAEAAPPSP
jgi:hypothetical protein